MKVSLRLYAGLRDAVGARDIVMELPEGARISDLKARMAEQYPFVRAMLPAVVFAVDDEYIPAEERLYDGAQVAAIPPVSGGAESATTPPGLFWVTAERLEPHQQTLIELVSRGGSGAIVAFYGVVRDNAEDRQVMRLEYEAHESMALRKMAEVAGEVKGRFPEIAEIGIWHRVGTLEVGEASLLVALSSPHRKEGFEACHWAIDRIKQVVPVWKREHFAGGDSAWVKGYTVDLPETAQP